MEGFEGTCPGEPARFRGITGVVPRRSLDEASDLAEGYRAAREVRVRVAWTSGGSSDTAVKAVIVARNAVDRPGGDHRDNGGERAECVAQFPVVNGPP